MPVHPGHRRGVALAVVLCIVALVGSACRRSTLPDALSDRDFWSLIDSLSEPPGVFTLSENFVSNEPQFADTLRRLRASRGAYIGVGPEQNFSYIARIRPRIAFIIDIRRENLALLLLYKALFELSTDRSDFVSRLFSRPRPPALKSNADVEEMFRQFDGVAPSPELYTKTSALVRERLLTTRGLPLPQGDLDWIDRAFKAFYDDGPKIDYYGARPLDAIRPSYRQLMTMKDLTGRYRSFLATESGFEFVKEMQTNNLVVPVVGDFGGPSAMYRVGNYVRAHQDRIHVLYASNVGVYLTNQQTYMFCASLATLPVATVAWFVESDGMKPFDTRLKACKPGAK